MMPDAGREARQANHTDRAGETRDACNGVVEFDGVALALADDDRGNGQLALREHVESGQSMTDRSEISADHKQKWNVEFRHPVKHSPLTVKWDHDSAHTFDEQWPGSGTNGRPAERDQFIKVDAPAFTRRSEIGG